MCGRFSSCFHENVFAFSWSVQLFLVPKSKWILMIHILKLQDPVREHTYIHTHTHTPARSPVREHTPLPAYKTRTKHGRRSGNAHTHSLPTRPARSRSGNIHTHTHHTHTPCLQDQHEAWSPVREHTHTHTPCLQDQHEAWSPVREHTHTHYKTRTKHGRRSGNIHTHTTRPARSMVAGQGTLHTHSLPTRPARSMVAGQGTLHTHSLPTRPARSMVAGQGTLHTHSLPTRPAWSRTYTHKIRTKKHPCKYETYLVIMNWKKLVSHRHASRAASRGAFSIT